MSDKPNRSKDSRAASKISLAPLTPDQALAAALRVKPADVKRLEAGEKKATKGKSTGKGKNK